MNKIEPILQNKCGVYMIINLVNGKRYVGSSVNIYQRLHDHVHNLKNNCAHNQHFQNSWNKHGEINFIYSVLEFCDRNLQFDREQFYIDLIQPEYNLSKNVIPSLGVSPSEQVRNKISETLKNKYKSGEIHTYRQQHLWVKTYIYNVRTIKLEAECNCRQDALRLLHGYKCADPEKTLYYNRYCLSSQKFENYNDLVNYINKNFLVANSKFGKYIIIEDENQNLKYYRTLMDCSRENSISKSTLAKHKKLQKNFHISLKIKN